MLIVGAGPAGACLALLLARGGVAVTLVEASRRFDRQFRGEGLMPSGLEVLAQLGLDPLPASIPHRALSGWGFHLGGRCLFEADEPMGSRRPCTLIDQGPLVRHLVAQAEALPGFRFLPGRAVAELLQEGSRVRGVVLDDGSREEADLVVGCDGRDSLVRQKAGLPLEHGLSPIDVLWFRLLDPAAGDIERWLGGRFVTVLGEGGSFAAFARAAGGVQLGWPVPAGSRPQESTLTWQERWSRVAPPALAALLRALPAEAIEGPLRLPVRVGLARGWQRPGLLLLGDAAHPMSPVRAQGLNMALRDALVAARTLLPVLLPAGEPADIAALDAALERIEAERRPEIERMQELQRQEARPAELLQGLPWLGRVLEASIPWSAPLLARQWCRRQRPLREGLPLAGPPPG